MASFAAQRLNDRRGESRGMARVRRSYEVAIDDDRRVLHPGCTGGFSVGLHDQFGVRRAVIEPRHAAAGNDPRAGGQHRPSADASDDSASSADVSYELGYAWIFGKQGRAFCTTWNEDADIVLGPRFRYRTLDILQAGPREIAVNLDRLLARGHHLHLVASLIEGDLGKEVLLLLKRVSDQSGNLRTSVGHGVDSRVFTSTRTVKGSDGRRPKDIRRNSPSLLTNWWCNAASTCKATKPARSIAKKTCATKGG